MPALVKGSVFPPIPFKVTVETRYSLHVLISESKVEWPMDTDPQESSLASTRLVTYFPLSTLWCLLLMIALHISLVPGSINLASSMKTSTGSSSCH
jgi:hypothetical protein